MCLRSERVRKMWTWNAELHSGVARAFASPIQDIDRWCHNFENAPYDPVIGKVLCVCAASAIARAVLADQPEQDAEATSALDLLDQWIDDPTDERFDQICAIISPEDEEPPDLGPHGVGFWALRTATSSVGNYEAGWALSSTCGSAESAGVSNEQLRLIVERAVFARRLKRD